MRKDLYTDDFIVITVNEEENKGIYADMLMGYMEFSVQVAEFIARKCKENMKHGYRLLDHIKVMRTQ